MAAKVSFWTRERVELACEVLGRHVVGRSSMQLIAAEFNRLAGSKVSTAAFEFAVKRCTGKVPTSFMRPRGSAFVPDERPTNPEGHAQPLERDEPEIPIDETEFEGIPENLRIVPKGHRLKGISLLVNRRTGEEEKEWQKTERRPDDPPLFELKPPSFALVRQSNMTGRQGEALVQWQRYEPKVAEQWDEMWRACREAAAEYEGRAKPTPAPELVCTRLGNVFPIGDPHVGMYAWSKETGEPFDCDIASRDLLRVMRTLMDRSPPAKFALIAQLGDFFHAEDDRNRTPMNGNPLDVDSRAGRVTKIGYEMMVGTVDLALERHDHVYLVNLRGNHDPYKSIALNLWLSAWYRNEPRVTVLDNNNPYVFFEHGLNLWGFHHGDGAKPEQLPGIMSTFDDGVPWGRTRFRRWFTGHVHSFNGRDFPGVTWESFRTLAPADFWAHWKGYRSEQSLDCLTFDELDGLVSRQTVSLKLARKLDP